MDVPVERELGRASSDNSGVLRCTTNYGKRQGERSRRAVRARRSDRSCRLAPAAIVLPIRLARVTLIMAVVAIAAGCTIFGFSALFLARRARLRSVVSLGRIGGAKQAAFGRLLGTLALGFGLGACIALPSTRCWPAADIAPMSVL